MVAMDPESEVPSGQSPPQLTASEMTPETYQFPTQQLRQYQIQPGKVPLVLVACGSFSPPTLLHLRMFSMASDFVRMNTDFELIGGYMSPVSDAYKKVGLAPAIHR
jgi:nicotinamide mononucleotide adenylyltransferase